MTKSEYQRYLCSREWAVLKEQVLRRSRGRCERCFEGKYESTHHVTYERIGHERVEDLLGVCNKCHKFLSGKTQSDPIRETTNKQLLNAFAACIELRSTLTDAYDAITRSGFENKPAVETEGAVWRAVIKVNEPLNILSEVLEWYLTEEGLIKESSD